MKHFTWQSTPVQVSDLMTGQTGSVREVVLDVPGMIRQLEVDVGLTADAVLGTWPVIVKSGRPNDPSPVKRSVTE